MIQVEKSDLLIGQYGAFEKGSWDSARPYSGSYAVTAFKTPENPSFTTLAVVAHNHGWEDTAKLGAEALVKSLVEVFDQTSTIEHVPGLLERGFVSANSLIEQMEDDAIGATGVAVAIAERRLYLASVGDCRVFLIRSEKCEQMSVAHTFPELFVERGLLDADELAQGYRPSSGAQIYRALGLREEIEVDLRLRLAPGETSEQSIANQGVELCAGDLVVLTNRVFREYVLHTDWELLKTSFSNGTNDPQALVDRFVEGLRQQNYIGDVTVVALKVPNE